jgi:hypothetical protein
MVSLPFGLNAEALISALAIVVGVVAYGFVGSMFPAFSYSAYLYPLLGIVLVTIGIHLDHAIGDVLVGFGAALSGATLKAALPTSL